MELQTVSQVTKTLGISARMLRYYEQSGLVKSLRKEDYSYRVYDNENIMRLHQIVILRKLQIPIKQIAVILNNPNAATVTEIFNENIKALDGEITALETIKSLLEIFAAKLSEFADVRLNFNLLTDKTMMDLAKSLSLTQRNVKEIKTMENLNHANETLATTAARNIIITTLPPMRTAAYHNFGIEPEDPGPTLPWIKENNLLGTARFFGFNSQALPTDKGPGEAYDFCVSIPENVTIPDYLYELKLPGGLYASLSAVGLDIPDVYGQIRNEFGDINSDWQIDHDRHDFPGLELHEGDVFGLVDSPLSITIFIPIKKCK
ncbi:MAG: MerR family transcriptional regulator [Oscillospiraceae bacterium]|nr:MerR family transcriptional regulator [Oscillospiraceae bacterium]